MSEKSRSEMRGELACLHNEQRTLQTTAVLNGTFQMAGIDPLEDLANEINMAE